MESVFCPAAPAHRMAWSPQGTGIKVKCSSCVTLQLCAPGKSPIACYWCENTVDVQMLPVCKNCGVPSAKGKRRTTDVRDLQNLLADYRTELVAHLDSGLKTGTQPPVEEMRANLEQQLRRTEMLLDESRLEVDRLTQMNQKLKEQSQPLDTEGPGLASVLEKLDEVYKRSQEVARENGALLEENKTLRNELSTHRTELDHHRNQPHHTPTASVPSVEGLSEIAEMTARKLVDVLPLINDIHVSDSWLKLKSMESLLSLSELGLQSPEMAVQMRKVSRVCVLIAKLVGPCRAVTSFGLSVKARLEEDPDKCLRLVRDLKRIYIKVSKDAGSAELMKELLLKLESGSPAFDSTVAVIAYLSEVLPPPQLKSLSEALFGFLEQPTGDTEDWIIAMSQMQLQWEEKNKEKALIGIRKLMAAVVKMNFDPACLQLLQILNSYKHPDPEPLMIFVSRASDALQSDEPKDHVQDLIKKLFDFMKMDLPAEKSSDLNGKALSALRVYFQGADVSKEQATLLMCMFLSLQTDTFDSLIWLYGDTTGPGNVEFALKLLKELEVHKNPLEHNAVISVKFFDSLAAATALTPQESLTFIKAVSQLCDAKDVKTEQIIVTLTSLLNNPASHLFVKEMAMLSDINESKDLVWETNKLLNTVRRYPTETVLPTARYMASMIVQLRNNDITTIVLNHALKVVLIEKTNHLKQLLAALRPIMKAEQIAANIAVKLIDLLPRQPDELVHLLSFIADLANNLSSAPMITSEMAINFCADAVLPCFFTGNVTLLVMMHAQLQAGRLSFLVEALRKAQRRLTTLDVYELCLLPNLQPELLRIFDCARQETKLVKLEQSIKVTNSSSYAFIDDGNLICCGGSESASGVISVSLT